MAKVKIGKWELEEEALEQQHLEAKQRGNEQLTREAQAHRVSYEPQANQLVVELKNGLTFLLPCMFLQGLAEAAPEDIAQVKLGPRGASLHWEKLDVNFGLTELITGVFGTRTWMKSIKRPGGTLSSKARSSAARVSRKSDHPSQTTQKEQLG